jgi:hypothetical protein
MNNIQFSFARASDGTETIVLLGARGVKVVPDTHVNYARIKTALLDQATNGDTTEEDVYRWADSATLVAETLRRLSERVTIKGDTVYFDGDPMESRLTDHIVDMLREEDDNWVGYVAFLENVQTNPSEASRADLFTFLNKHGLVITQDGCFIAYKSVQKDGRSHTAGHEEVTVTLEDGTVETHIGKIPNPVGATVETPRSQVDNNSGIPCSVGLHVGSFTFADGFYGGSGSDLRVVSINPRDVVSVPSDSNGQKVRVSRYTVVADNPDREHLSGTSYTLLSDLMSSVDRDSATDDDDGDECEYCGYYDCDGDC